MKRLISLLILCICFTNVSIAQNDEEGAIKLFDESHVTVSSHLFSRVPRITVGFITSINYRWLAGIEIGFNGGFTAYERDNTWIGSNYKLFEIRPQLYYTFTNNPKIRSYISGELFYINHQDTFRNEFFILSGTDLNVEFESADYTRIKTGINFHFGVFKSIYKGFGINPSIGLGLRYRKVDYRNVRNGIIIDPNNLDDEENLFGSLDNYITDEGSTFGFNMVISIKLYYKF
ncbi:MAG: hypothetical protein HRT68_04560 [Flavobacteriaceae bacterium]|nr:hypothetical protein [Flavobacteriaceae bacterium]